MTRLLRLQDACFDEVGHGSSEDVDLTVDSGELVVVTGRSGAGKTVVARGALGFVEARSGEVELFDVAVAGLDHDRLLELRRRCAFSSTSAPLLSNQSVRDNVALPLVMRGMSPAQVGELVDDVLDRFDLLPVAVVRPEALLPKDRERALVARALAVPAELFILDDPPLPAKAAQLLVDKVRAGAGALIVGTAAGAFPEATRLVELRAR